MTQPPEKAQERRKPKIQPNSLLSLRQITDRMRKVICAALNDEMDSGNAFRKVRMLERLRLSVATSHYEDRLEALEARVKPNGAGHPNGSYAPSAAEYDDGDDLDDDRRLQ